MVDEDIVKKIWQLDHLSTMGAFWMIQVIQNFDMEKIENTIKLAK